MYNFCNKEISAPVLGTIKLHNALFECLNLFNNLIFLRYIVSETTQLKYNKQSLTTSFDLSNLQPQGNCYFSSAYILKYGQK